MKKKKKKKREITTINITTHNNTAAGKRQITAKINNEEQQDAPQRSLTIQFSYSNRFKFCPNNKVFHFIFTLQKVLQH